MHIWNFPHVLFGKFHANSSDSEILYKNPTSSTSSLLYFFSFSSLFSFTFLYNKAINECYHIHPLTPILILRQCCYYCLFLKEVIILRSVLFRDLQKVNNFLSLHL